MPEFNFDEIPGKRSSRNSHIQCANLFIVNLHALLCSVHSLSCIPGTKVGGENKC